VTLVGYAAMLGIAAALAWPLRRTALWPVALPVALALGESGFVQTWDLQVQLPGFPVPLGWLDIVFGALVVSWLLVRRVSPADRSRGLPVGLDVAVLVAWFVIVAIAVPLAWVDGGAVKLGIAWTVLSYSYVPLSAAMLYDMLRRTNRAAVQTLLRSLSVVTSVLAVFYILHMLGLSIYDLARVNSTYSYVAGVRRDILTFPVWACLTVPFLLWSERIRFIDSCMVVVQVAAVAASLTRSLVLACLLAVLFIVASRFVAGRRPFEPLLPVGIGAVSAAVLAWSLPGFIDRSLAVLLSRFDELSAGVTSVANVASRLGVGERVSSFLSGWGLWMGAGFSDAALARSQASLGQLLVDDSLWSIVLLRFGLIGVTLVAATIVVGIVSGVVAARRLRREPLAMAAVGTAALVWLAARTAASSEIVNFYPMVLAFILALIMVEARDAWSESDRVLRVLLGRGDAPELPAWVPRGAAAKVAAIALLVIVEFAIGRAIAR
jgi:hypothetical protein